jgi:hypothetical protein
VWRASQSVRTGACDAGMTGGTAGAAGAGACARAVPDPMATALASPALAVSMARREIASAGKSSRVAFAA